MERSIQAKFLIPIVVSLVAGVSLAFFVTLLLVPALYAIGIDVGALKTRLRQRVKDRLAGRKSTDEDLALDRGR
jgi:hypothetical protein